LSTSNIFLCHPTLLLISHNIQYSWLYLTTPSNYQLSFQAHDSLLHNFSIHFLTLYFFFELDIIFFSMLQFFNIFFIFMFTLYDVFASPRRFYVCFFCLSIRLFLIIDFICFKIFFVIILSFLSYEENFPYFPSLSINFIRRNVVLLGLKGLFLLESFLFFKRKFLSIVSYSTAIENLKGNLPLYFSIPLLRLLTEYASSSYDSLPGISSTMCYLFFGFFVALKYASLFGCPCFVYVIISYVVRIPCISSIVILVKSLVSSMTETLASYLKGIDLNFFYNQGLFEFFS
jgi:hypothetical protein